MERLALFEHMSRFDDWRETMTSWIAEKKLTYHVDVLERFENLPKGLIRLFTGGSTGKQLIRLASAAS
jgi:NADPH-dependent curcumin reductase CurA